MRVKQKTLSAPLRVYWALVPEGLGGISTPDALRIAAELASLKVFFVTLRLPGAPRADLADIIATMKPGVRVTVSVTEPDAFPVPEALGRADGLDLMPRDLDGLDALLRLASGHMERGFAVSVSVVPAKDGIGFMDGALAASVAAGVRVFNLPNPDLTGVSGDRERFVLDASARAGFKRVIEARLGPSGADAKLNVHDLFLHRELKLPGLGGRIEYAGCQAGDALAFIDGAGVVYPCSTWPDPMGRIGAHSFAEIWAGDVRMAVRKAAASLPVECAECDDARDCKGGCVGMAAALGRPGSKDPGCGR